MLIAVADLSKLTLNDSRDSNETATSGGFGGPNAPLLRHQQPSSACPPPPPPLPPMMSNGSNGSNGDVGGIWGAGPTAPATSTLAPGGYVLPPTHQSPSGGELQCAMLRYSHHVINHACIFYIRLNVLRWADNLQPRGTAAFCQLLVYAATLRAWVGLLPCPRRH